MTERVEDFKIIFGGLDNAGKTSFLIALRKKYNFFESVENLKPTIKIDYQTFDLMGKKIDLWDMGGQEKYRKMYMNKKIYFEETNYFYYLIDIQDELRLNSSVNYLYEILDIFRKTNYSNEVIICFHKYDPEFLENDQFKARTQMVKNLVCTQNEQFKFRFFNTSYYNISSLSKAFSYSMSNLLNLEELNFQFKEFLEKCACDYIILYTNTGIILVDQYRDILDPKSFEKTISERIQRNLEFFQRLNDEDAQMNERVVLTNENFEYIKKISFSERKNPTVMYIATFGSRKILNKINSEINSIENYLLRIKI
ncbi:MAG: ADP-ribosylation factor-like protein [Candidatus Lokiarchaeota archaeon]